MPEIKHVAIIMDGNGRWANQRFHPRIWGHVRGSAVVSNIVQAAHDVGLCALTLYAFSTENWSRPIEEVTSLFKLLKKFLLREKERILKNNIQFKVIGELTNLPEETKKLIKTIEELTKNAKGLKLTFAFSYGGRAEILKAINSFSQKYPGKEMSEKDLSSHLYRPEIGDVDLMIRTGGDQRISNFLLWQMAYAELYFTDTMWPDFSVPEFKNILSEVATRERRFGFVSSQKGLEETTEQAKLNKAKYLKDSISDV